MKTITLPKAIKEMLGFAAPLVGFRTVSAINGFISMLLVAMLGRRELAASALITSTQITLSVIGWSVLFAISVIVGFVVGQGKTHDLGKILRQGWLLGLILSVPMMIIFWHVGPILRFFGQQESLVALIQPYFHVITFSVLPGMLYVSFLQFVTGLGKPRIVLCFSLVNVVFLLAPAYLLLFGKFGFPHLGLIGLAYAYVFVYWAAFFMGLTYLLVNPDYKKLQIFKFVREDFYYFKKILQIGVPMSIQFASELTAFAFATIMIGWINQASLAAWQIITQINIIVIMGPFGISQASGVLVGKSLGKGDKPATRIYGEAGLLIGLILTLVVAIIYLVFPKIIVSFYSIDVNNPANAMLLHIAIMLFSIRAFSQIFDGLRNIATGVLRGYHDTIMPMWIGIIASWGISIPLGYFMGLKLHWGAPGILMGFLVAWLFGSVLLVRRFYHKTSK